MTKTRTQVAAENVRKRLRMNEKDERGPVTLYLSKSLYKSFKRACEPAAASTIVEELMREFLGQKK